MSPDILIQRRRGGFRNFIVGTNESAAQSTLGASQASDCLHPFQASRLVTLCLSREVLLDNKDNLGFEAQTRFIMSDQLLSLLILILLWSLNKLSMFKTKHQCSDTFLGMPTPRVVCQHKWIPWAFFFVFFFKRMRIWSWMDREVGRATGRNWKRRINMSKIYYVLKE